MALLVLSAWQAPSDNQVPLDHLDCRDFEDLLVRQAQMVPMAFQVHWAHEVLLDRKVQRVTLEPVVLPDPLGCPAA